MSHIRNILDEYAMTTMLGSSPQKTVYRSLEPGTDRDVVVKMLSSADASGDRLDRHPFLRAVGAIQFLRLPAFPEILDFGFTDDHSAFMVMEWIDGKNLTALAGAQPQQTIPILIQVAEALEALAMGEVYHHNLSPDNILVQTRPEGDAAQIVGFGTAAFFSETTAGTILDNSSDTDRFIAPELLGGSQDGSIVGALADLYSLALITVDVLGGEVLNLGTGDPEVHFSDGVRTALPNAEVLKAALTGALATAPDKRQVTLPILKNALERSLAPEEGIGVTSTQEPVGVSTPPPLLTEDTGEEATTEGEILVLGPRDTGGLIDEDLIEIDPVAFDPNRTDPLIMAKTQIPPPLPPKQARRGKATLLIPAWRKFGLRLNRRFLVWVPVALVIIVIITFGIVMLRRLTHRPQPNPQPVTVVQPTPPPVSLPSEEPTKAEIHPALEKADALLLEGDVEGARAILSAITAEEIGNFSNDEADAFRTMKDALEGSRLDAAVSDLEGGLQYGSIRMLKRGVAGLQRLDSEEFADRPEVGVMLKRAQAALRLHTLMWEAHEAQNHTLVLERTVSMIEALPGYSTSIRFREEAASTLENLSDRANEIGDFDQARKLLEPVNTFWPERKGLTQRSSAINETEQRVGEQRTQIARALAEGRSGDPEAGLALLSAVTPEAVLQGSFSEALNLLQQHLAELDAQPPVVELRPETVLTFKKKKTVTIRLVITDDHRVTGAVAYLKTAGATVFSQVDLTLDESTDSYSFKVGPETHNNDDFLFFVEATDGSGHTGRLGSPEAPLEVKRKKGLKALFGK